MLKKFSPFGLLFYFLAVTACKKEVAFGEKDFQALGVSAHDLLSSDIYTSLTIEVDYMPGYAPNDTVRSNLESFLDTHINKPVGIKLIQKQVPSSNQTSLNLDNIVDLEKAYRKEYTVSN